MTPRTRRDRRAIRICYLLLALLPIAAYCSGRAHADPAQDRAYITTLQHFAVPYSTVPKVIDAGHAVCDGIDRGLTPIGVVNIAVRAGWNQTDAAHLVGAAIGSYCGEYLYLIDTPTQGQIA